VQGKRATIHRSHTRVSHWSKCYQESVSKISNTCWLTSIKINVKVSYVTYLPTHWLAVDDVSIVIIIMTSHWMRPTRSVRSNIAIIRASVVFVGEESWRREQGWNSPCEKHNFPSGKNTSHFMNPRERSQSLVWNSTECERNCSYEKLCMQIEFQIRLDCKSFYDSFYLLHFCYF